MVTCFHFTTRLQQKNAITYCHFPYCEPLDDCGDPDYSAALQNMCLLGMTPALQTGITMLPELLTLNDGKLYCGYYSNFSRKAILKSFV